MEKLTREEIESNIVLVQIKNKLYKATIKEILLDFPIVYLINKKISFEISWELAIKAIRENSIIIY